MTSFNSIIDFLKKYYKQVTIGLLVLFVLYWLIFILTPSVKMSGVAVQEIRKLDEEIGTIKLEQNILYTEIQQYEEQLQGMDENISQINYTQNKISGEYGEKINAARSYDYQQLVAFLSKRYSESGIH
jgi:predicted PurR-regulated permease PerM